MLKVLHIPKWFPTQNAPYDGIFVQRHIEASSSFVNNYVIFALAKTQKSWFELEIEHQKVIVYYKKEIIGLQFIDKIIKIGLYFLALQKAYNCFFKHEKPSLVHVHVLLRTGIFAYFLQITKQIPYVITEHWTGYLPEHKHYKGLFLHFLNKLIIKNANCIMPVSYHLQNAMQNFRKLKGNYTVVNNVVDNKIFYPQELVLNSQKKQIVMVADMVIAHKNYITILNSVQELAKIRKDFKLTIFGEGPDKELIFRFVSDNKLADFIEFLGYQTPQKIAKVMNESAFLLLYSNYENAPCCISEAQFCGLPVLVSNVGGIPEMVSEKEGIVLEITSPELLTSQLNLMLDNYLSFDSEHIVNISQSRYNYKSVGEKLFKIYEESVKKLDKCFINIKRILQLI